MRLLGDEKRESSNYGLNLVVLHANALVANPLLLILKFPPKKHQIAYPKSSDISFLSKFREYCLNTHTIYQSVCII